MNITECRMREGKGREGKGREGKGGKGSEDSQERRDESGFDGNSIFPIESDRGS